MCIIVSLDSKTDLQINILSSFVSFHPCRRKAYDHRDTHAFVSCLGKRKSKHKVLYSSLHSGLFEGYDMVLYEPVIQVKDFHYRTLILIGESRSKVRVGAAVGVAS